MIPKSFWKIRFDEPIGKATAKYFILWAGYHYIMAHNPLQLP